MDDLSLPTNSSMDPPRQGSRRDLQLHSAPKRRASFIHARADSSHPSDTLHAALHCQPSQALPLVRETSDVALHSSTKDHPTSRESEQHSSSSSHDHSPSHSHGHSHSHWFTAAARTSGSRQAVLWVLLLVCLSAGLGYLTTVPAVRSDKAVLQASPRLVPQYAYDDSRRSLVEGDALSNSNGCLGTIPKCEPGACATRNVMGVARWVCLRCLANYEPVTDASGQDNILQCVCPRGHYEASPNATSCTRCPSGSYCPGGQKVENPTTRGTPMQCGSSLVTRNTGARSQTDCVAPAGYALSSPTAATACGRSQYAPMYNRLSKCLTCQSGLEEPLASNLTASQRDSKRAVCKVPPGKYVSQGLVRICPQGFYRQNYVPFDAQVGTLCLPCNPGVTTIGPGSKSPAECNRVLPGYGIDNVYGVTSVMDIPTLPQDDKGLPAASVCDIGFYSGSGYCIECPSGTVTQSKGSKSIEECVVPPGYFINQTRVMGPCQSGFFREGWLMFSDPRATSCTLCGDNIRSEPKDLDMNPRAANGSLVRATSSSCYIEAGQGMIAQGKNQFAAMDCPINSYGAAGPVFGWAAAPCKPCARNMITDGLTKVNNSDVCINPDGFGYASEGASRCAPGFYSLKGSRKPCQQCPTGRTTLDDTAAQRLITDCLVKPGFGVVSSTGNSTDAFNLDTTGLTNEQLVALPVLECPTGYYSGGNSTGAKCLACPAGSATQAPGSTSAADCNVCTAGYGKATNASATCELCPIGSYQPGGLTQCQSCPSSSFYAPVDGAGETWTSEGLTTFLGATGAESCVPKQSQLSPEAGQAYFRPESAIQALLSSSIRASLGACLAACPAGSCCLAQYDVPSQLCKTAMLAPVAADAAGLRLLYKLPPSTLGSASSITPSEEAVGSSSVRASMISSGIYALCGIPTDTADAWKSVGSGLTADARTFSANQTVPIWVTGSEAECRRKCDDSNVCWGVVYDGSQGMCTYKGGVDAIKTRSFFVIPTSVDLASLNWQAVNRNSAG